MAAVTSRRMQANGLSFMVDEAGEGQDVAVLLQHRQVQVQLAGKMLVENGLAHTGAVGDLVHTG